ncbi:hypothetical protein VIGAN_03064100 [Vigna angularis var. angularis]|uniref:Uncharacterized protein n=1 Tax=Vigna angularis var. angularis TaxID=157739 RepID=A0A0S3RK77_PHAAN|nr:hypothetical protein VIGAN_03064100 [Vigna angularis var. angularis]
MRTTNYENFEELLSNKVNRLAEFTFNGKWNEVEKMYNVDPACHTATIDDFVGTALHVAVDLDEEVVVEKLVNAIMRYETKEALQMRNVRGDTALHVAASRGFTKICQIIVGENRERIYLVNRKNNDGETPLFQAALNWKKQAFAYLSDLYGHSAPLQDLVRYNGDSILHCAIRNEYFDLAVIILHYYDFLGVCMNKDGELPLKVLATKPSAFYSSTYLSLLRRVQYLRVHVEPFEPEREMRAILREMKPQKLLNENCPRNYAVLTSAFTGLFGFFGLSGKLLLNSERRDPEKNPIDLIPISHVEERRFPPNYKTILQFVQYVYALISAAIGGINELKETKKKHQLGPRLLKQLLERPYEATTGGGGVPSFIDTDMYNVYSQSMRAYEATTVGGGVPSFIDTDMYYVYIQSMQGIYLYYTFLTNYISSHFMSKLS